MKKQHLEEKLSNTLKNNYPEVYYLKLQVMPLAFHPMPADFIVLTDKKNFLIECKEISYTNFFKSGFPFSRITQEESLIIFSKKFKFNYSYILLGIYKGSIKKSDLYLISIEDWKIFKNSFDKKSFNCKDIFLLNKFKIQVKKGSFLDISKLFKPKTERFI